MPTVTNHDSPSLSDLDRKMIAAVPPGGNWQETCGWSLGHVNQVRRRSLTRRHIHTTYYGRLRWDQPAYTISTYYSRSGNGCFIHPAQDRLITNREAARLQSFPDSFVFAGPRRSITDQIGNAVPPLLAASLAQRIRASASSTYSLVLGGMSHGFCAVGRDIVLAVEADPQIGSIQLERPAVPLNRRGSELLKRSFHRGVDRQPWRM